MGKGGDFEREIFKKISLWFSAGKRDDIFYRSHNSGARFTMRKKAGKDTANQCGDMTFTDPIGKPLCDAWNVELKTGYGKKKKKIKDDSGDIIKKIDQQWDILDMIDSKQKESVLDVFWEQCTKDADISKREPILIFRRNRRTPCIVMRNAYFFILESFFGRPKNIIIIIIKGFPEKRVIISLSDFMKWIPDIMEILKENGNV